MSEEQLNDLQTRVERALNATDALSSLLKELLLAVKKNEVVRGHVRDAFRVMYEKEGES